MTRFFTIFIALIVVAVLAIYMVTFQVRYDQVAVKTTFENSQRPVILDSTVRSVSDLPTNGVLDQDAVFYLTVNTAAKSTELHTTARNSGSASNAEPARVIVSAKSTQDNADQDKPLEALRSDVGSALDSAGLGDQVNVDLANNRLVLAAKNAGSTNLAIKQVNATSAEHLFSKHVTSAGSLYTKAGLYFKAPWPIQKVKTYPKQVQMLEDQLEELRTSDDKSVIVRTYLAWRIKDPYSFFYTVETIPEAEDDLKTLLRDVRGVISQYSFDQLVNTDKSKLKLAEVEDQCAQQIRRELARIKPSYGIEVEQVGIRRLILPKATTKKVFERMRGRQERLAENARSEGEATAATIRSDANRAKQTILAFAERRAQAIRAKGDQEAAKYYKAFDAAPEFARFLRQMEALKKMLAKHSTFILDTDDLNSLEMFRQGPKVATDSESGKLKVTPSGKQNQSTRGKHTARSDRSNQTQQTNQTHETVRTDDDASATTSGQAVKNK